MRLRIFAALVFATLAGCAPAPLHLYQGEHQPADQLAQVATYGLGGQVFVRTINGYQLDIFERDAPLVYVKPGKNTFGVQYWTGGPTYREISDVVTTEVTVEAGHLYAFHYEINDPTRPVLWGDVRVRFTLVDYGRDLPPACHPIAIGTGGPRTPRALECIAKHTP